MSASQVRFLSLQHRKHDIGRELTTLSNRKMALSRDMNRVSKNYTNALNQNVLKWSNDSGANYYNLTYDLMMKPNDLNSNMPYIVSSKGGAVVVDDVANLIGRNAEGEFGALEGKKIQCADYYQTVYGDSWSGVQDELNYTNLAKWITKTVVEDGSLNGQIGNIATNIENKLAGSANVGAYVIPENTITYGFEDTLRYQIFQELGLVNDQTSAEFQELLKNRFGDEAAYNFGDYDSLLQYYVNAASDDNKIRGMSDFKLADPKQICDYGRVEVAGVKFDEFAAYFGQIDDNNVWHNGCLEGNLALAQYALTEYDQWLSELHELNLSEDTTVAFSASSGRNKTWTIPAVLDMNSFAEGATEWRRTKEIFETLDSAADGNPSTGENSAHGYFDVSWLNTTAYGHSNLSDTTWEAIFDDHTGTNSTIILDQNAGQGRYETFATFLSAIISNANKASSFAANNENTDGTTWTFINTIDSEKDIISLGIGSDGEEEFDSVTTAALDYAYTQTLNYYRNLSGYSCFRDTSDCDGGWVPLTGSHSFSEWNESVNNSIGDNDQTNGWGHAVESTCGFHSFFQFLGGLLGAIVLGCTGIGQILELCGVGVLTGLADSMFEAWDTRDGKTSIDMNNVMQTFFTYYEMFTTDYKESGGNRITGEGIGGTTTPTYTNKVSTAYRAHAAQKEGSIPSGTALTKPAANTSSYTINTAWTNYENQLKNAGYKNSSGNALYNGGGRYIGDSAVKAGYDYVSLQTDEDGNRYYTAVKYKTYDNGPLAGMIYASTDYYEANPAIGGWVIGSQILGSDPSHPMTEIPDIHSKDLVDDDGNVIGWCVTNASNADRSTTYNGVAYTFKANTTTYVWDTVQTATSRHYNDTIHDYDPEVTVNYTMVVVDDNEAHTDTYHVPKYYETAGNNFSASNERTVSSVQVTMSDVCTAGGKDLNIGFGTTKFGTKTYVYLTKDRAFENRLIQDVIDARQAIEDAKEAAERFYSAKEQKLMDYYKIQISLTLNTSITN